MLFVLHTTTRLVNDDEDEKAKVQTEEKQNV